MNKKSIEEQIKQFNEENKPFSIMDHENGQYSLGLRIDFLCGEYKDYCQEAFDAYSLLNGENPREGRFRAHGNGYEWEAAFRKAFENDPNLKLIEFDCESGGFFCNCQDVSILADFGQKFRAICEDASKFLPLIIVGIQEYEDNEEWQEEKTRIERSIRARLLRYPLGTFDIRTPDGDFHVKPGMGRKLIEGTMPTITSECGKTTLDAEDFLNMRVTERQRDLLDKNKFQLIAQIEQTETPSLSMQTLR